MIKKITSLPLPELSKVQLQHFGILEDLLMFDIETTGFSRSSDTIISITALIFSQTEMTCIQWFSTSPEEEIDVLKDVVSFFNNKPIHITYNGHTFDIPFLNYKYQYYSISAALNKSKTYDLYRICRKALQLDSYKLKSIEVALGIHREDEISGKACTELYAQYLNHSRQDVPELILLHNYEDVINLVSLSRVIDQHPDVFHAFKFSYLIYKGCHYYLNAYHIYQDSLKLSIQAYPFLVNHNCSTQALEYFYTSGESIRSSFENQSHMLDISLAVYQAAHNGFPLVLYHPESNIVDTFNPNLNNSPTTAVIMINNMIQFDNLFLLLTSILDKLFLSQ